MARPPAEGAGSVAVVGRGCEPSWKKVALECEVETAYIREGEGRDLPSTARGGGKRDPSGLGRDKGWARSSASSR